VDDGALLVVSDPHLGAGEAEGRHALVAGDELACAFVPCDPGQIAEVCQRVAQAAEVLLADDAGIRGVRGELGQVAVSGAGACFCHVNALFL
jgi:hypothetical protein